MAGSRVGWARRAVAATVILAAVIVLAGSTAGGQSTSSAATARGVTAHAKPLPILGILEASGNYLAQEKAAGIQAITIQVGWANVEPTQGVFSASYMSQIQAKIAAARSAGLDVELDPGLQYPPPWVFSLPGGTQFVDQYGDVFTGAEPSGNDVANAVTDLSVRSAEGTYLTWLGGQITAGEIIAVREGGGPLGELRYPLPDESGHTNEFWAYDSSTQAALPPSVQGWVPGTGTQAQATTFLNAYNQAIDDYGTWLNGQLQTDFATKVLVLLPGWGERPGGAASEEAGLLAPNPPMNEFNEGLDWTDLLDALPDAANSVAYTTYLDAQTVLPTPQLEDPADYLASLVAGTTIGLGGENTGNGTLATMKFCMSQAVALGFYVVNWNGESQVIASDSGQDAGRTHTHPTRRITDDRSSAALDRDDFAPGRNRGPELRRVRCRVVGLPARHLVAERGHAPAGPHPRFRFGSHSRTAERARALRLQREGHRQRAGRCVRESEHHRVGGQGPQPRHGPEPRQGPQPVGGSDRRHGRHARRRRILDRRRLRRRRDIW